MLTPLKIWKANMEEILIKNVRNGIRAIRMGTKTPSEANVGVSLNKLKSLNEGMYLELMEDYKKVLEEFKNKSAK